MGKTERSSSHCSWRAISPLTAPGSFRVVSVLFTASSSEKRSADKLNGHNGLSIVIAHRNHFCSGAVATVVLDLYPILKFHRQPRGKDRFVGARKLDDDGFAHIRRATAKQLEHSRQPSRQHIEKE